MNTMVGINLVLSCINLTLLLIEIIMRIMDYNTIHAIFSEKYDRLSKEHNYICKMIDNKMEILESQQVRIAQSIEDKVTL